MPPDEEMAQANLLEDASELAEKQLASEAASARRTPAFARAQAECDAVAQAKQDELDATMNSTTPAELAAAYKELDEKKALVALANREKREKQKAEDAASAGVANSGHRREGAPNVASERATDDGEHRGEAGDRLDRALLYGKPGGVTNRHHRPGVKPE